MNHRSPFTPGVAREVRHRTIYVPPGVESDDPWVVERAQGALFDSGTMSDGRGGVVHWRDAGEWIEMVSIQVEEVTHWNVALLTTTLMLLLVAGAAGASSEADEREGKA